VVVGVPNSTDPAIATGVRPRTPDARQHELCSHLFNRPVPLFSGDKEKSKITRRPHKAEPTCCPYTGLPKPHETNSAESIVRRAYHMAEGDVNDMEGFKNLFADDGVIRASGKTYQGDNLASILYFAKRIVPDVHREILRVHTIGNLVVVEMAFRGTYTGTFDTPAGPIKGNGTKVDAPGVDLWYVENGKIKEFDCYLEVNVLQEQLGLLPALVVKR
jgi:SnoaL-like domain